MRLRFPLAALAVASLLASGAARAQTAEEILGKYYRAVGAEKLRAVKTVRMVGTTTLPVVGNAAFRFERMRPAAVRQEITVQDQTAVQAFDGKTAWSFAPFLGQTKPQILPEEAAAEAKASDDFDGPLVDWKAKGSAVELLGEGKFGEKDAWMLKVTPKEGPAQTFYLDAATFLPVRMATEVETQGQTVPVEVLFRDYRDVSGIQFPFEMESRAVGEPSGQIVKFETIEVNVPFEASRFAPPADAEPAPAPQE